jgi:hypothetical protein
MRLGGKAVGNSFGHSGGQGLEYDDWELQWGWMGWDGAERWARGDRAKSRSALVFILILILDSFMLFLPC